jgi:LuxR family quorum sensing-dependent transcriptional regulator
MGQATPFTAAQLQHELFDALSVIEGAGRSEEMPAILQSVVRTLGFDSYAYLDGAADAVEGGRVITTVSRDWQETYLAEGFAEHDPCTVRALSSNAPFLWNDIPLGTIEGAPTIAQKTMLTAREFGYVDGVVLPLHVLDGRGEPVSNICSLFWKGSQAECRREAEARLRSMQLIAGSWSEKLATFDERPHRPLSGASILTGLFDPEPKLRDREIDVLSWAAKGKTADETAVILGLGRETVTTHLARACKRLGAANKTHAVAIAVQRRLVRP